MGTANYIMRRHVSIVGNVPDAHEAIFRGHQRVAFRPANASDAGDDFAFWSINGKGPAEALQAALRSADFRLRLGIPVSLAVIDFQPQPDAALLPGYHQKIVHRVDAD